jgi:cytochrome c oxidase subunit III
VKRRFVDVGALPTIAFGHRDPLWWATLLLVAIEGTMLLLLAIAYFYVRDRTSPWPPTLSPRWLAWLATAELAALVASAAPMFLAGRAAERGSVVGMRRGLIVATLFGVVAAGCRWVLFRELPFRWDAHAYGSVVWMLLGTQAVHGLTGLGENLLFIALLYRGPVEQKHRVDVHVTSLLWYFVIAGSALLWAVVFAEIFLTGVG